MDVAHLHLMITHGPVAGIIFGFLLVAFGYWWSDRRALQIGMVAFIGTALLAVLLYFTGEGAEEVVEGLTHVSHEAIEAHEQAAVYAILGSLVLAGLSGFGLYRYRADTIPPGFGRALLLISLVVGVLIGWTANRGGQISHPEIRAEGATVESVEADDQND